MEKQDNSNTRTQSKHASKQKQRRIYNFLVNTKMLNGGLTQKYNYIIYIDNMIEVYTRIRLYPLYPPILSCDSAQVTDKIVSCRTYKHFGKLKVKPRGLSLQCWQHFVQQCTAPLNSLILSDEVDQRLKTLLPSDLDVICSSVCCCWKFRAVHKIYLCSLLPLEAPSTNYFIYVVKMSAFFLT